MTVHTCLYLVKIIHGSQYFRGHTIHKVRGEVAIGPSIYGVYVMMGPYSPSLGMVCTSSCVRPHIWQHTQDSSPAQSHMCRVDVRTEACKQCIPLYILYIGNVNSSMLI